MSHLLKTLFSTHPSLSIQPLDFVASHLFKDKACNNDMASLYSQNFIFIKTIVTMVKKMQKYISLICLPDGITEKLIWITAYYIV